MTASRDQREHDETSHVARVAQKLVWLGAVSWIAVACDADPPAGPVIDPDDVDGDGVPNAEDICPTSKDPRQHDEDGDRFGDACDVCPTIPDPRQSDTGEEEALQFADGVGDACDPRPDRAGEKLAGLHTFADGTNVAQFTSSGWTAMADALHATMPASWTVARPVIGDALYLRAEVAALAWDAPAGADASFTVGVDGDGTGLVYTCSVVRDRDGDGFDELVIVETSGSTMTKSLGVAIAGPLSLTVWRAIDRDRIGRVLCAADVAGARHELMIVTEDFSTGFYGFASTGAVTSLSSVVAYSSPPNPCMRRSCEDEP